METTELNIRISFSRKSVLSLLVLFFLCWHPGFIASENLVLTTYYPAPYGGYVNILTTGRTLLARDGTVAGGSIVGIGTNNPDPGSKVHIAGAGSGSVDLRVNGRLMTGADGSGNGGMWLGSATDGFVGNNGGNIGFWTSGAGWNAFQINKANGRVGINTMNPTERLHVAGGNIRIEDGNLNISGNGASTGFINGLCQTVGYALNAPASCFSAGSGYRVIATYSSSSCSSGGLIFRGGVLQDPNRWIPLNIEGCTGTMLCCRIP